MSARRHETLRSPLRLADLIRQRRRGDESGFALAITLVVLFVGSLLVMAMLGLAFTTTTFANDQMGRDQDTRAADSAIQSAVARLARDSTAKAGSMEDSQYCGWVPTGSQTEADRPTMKVPVNGRDVEVTCTASEPDAYAPEKNVGDQVQVVGGYKGAGSSPDVLSSIYWRATPASGECRITTDGCFPWREAADAGDSASGRTGTIDDLLPELQSSSNDVGISHSGSDPLRLIGNVQVREGAGVLRNDRGSCPPNSSGPCTYLAKGPGLSVSGAYSQGAKGWLTTANSNPVNPDCGVLQEQPVTAMPRPFQIAGAQVKAESGVACDSAGSRNLDAATTKLPVHPGAVWTPADVESKRPPAPVNGSGAAQDWAAGCPSTSNRLVKFGPGAYTKDLTATLNRWFNSCTGFVFLFQPGHYWFDSDDGSASVRRNTIRMENASNYYVFGAPRGWTTYVGATAVKPSDPLCDPTVSGVTITLSARASFVHRAGVVNICGIPPASPTAQPFATIWQESTPDLGVVDGSTQVAGGTQSSGYFSPWGIKFIDSVINFFGGNIAFDNPITVANVPFTASAGCIVGCSGRVSFATRFSPPGGSTTPDAAVNSAVLTVAARSDGANGSGSSTRVDVFLPKNPNNVACSMNFPRIPDGADSASFVTVAYDLMDRTVPGNCSSVIQSRKDLLDANIVVTFVIDSQGLRWSGNYSVSVNAVNLVTGWVPRSVGGVTCAVSGQGANTCSGLFNTGSVPATISPSTLDGGGTVVPVRMNRKCVRVWLFVWFDVCASTPSAETASFVLRNLDDRYNPDLAYAPSATLSAAGVMVQGRTQCNYWAFGNHACAPDNDNANAPGARVRVRLVSNGVTVCQAEYRRLPDYGETRYLDLFANTGDSVASNSCKGYLTGKRNADIIGKDLYVDFVMVKRTFFSASILTGNLCMDPACNWWGYDVDRISFTTASGDANPADAFKGPRVPMRITSNNSPSSTLPNGQPNPNYVHNARFTMYGPLSLPGNDLDIRWSGPMGVLPVVSGYEANAGNPIRTMVVRGIGSDSRPDVSSTTPTVGVACCAKARPAERLVQMRAYIGRPAGQKLDDAYLRAVATVRIVDQVPDPPPGVDPAPLPAPQPGTFQAGNLIRVEEFRVCTRGTATEGCAIW